MPTMLPHLRLAAILACMALPAAAQPADTIRPPDAARLAAFDAHLGAGLYAALTRGTAPDRAVLLDVLRGAPGPLDPAGDWACRTLKLGGITDLTVYPNFRCRVSAGPDGALTLVKLTGSQRVVGRILADGTFLGVGHVGDAPATDYAGLPPKDQTPVEPNQTTADVGRFEQMSGGRARLMLPAPLLESRFDILYLTR